jgi:D-alanyl-D-alanine carboxypeptidase
MKDSGYDWTRPLLKKRASGYAYNRTTKAYANADFLDMSLPHAAGSLYSTTKDLYQWDRALAAGKLLNRESYNRMFTAGKKDYAYGWVVQTSNGRKSIGHGGGINGFSTMIMRYPAEDAVVVVLSNVENGDAAGLARALGGALFGEKVELPWEYNAIELDPAILSRYTGVYQLPPFKMTVTVETGKLMVQADGQPKIEIQPMSETRFFNSKVEAVIEFNGDELILKQGGGELRGKRISQ